MLAVSRKRLRGLSSPALAIDTSTFRHSIAARISGLPANWRRAAAFAGVSDVDTFLVHLGRSIAAALESVAQSAESAHVQLSEMRAALHASIDARCDELRAMLDSAQSAKAAALELELVAVDASLEKWRAVYSTVCAASSSLSDADLETQHATLSSRLVEVETHLQVLPTAVVEPPLVGLLADTPALLSNIGSLGRVLAPLSVTAANLILLDVPSSVRPGGTLHLHLSLGARHAAQSAEELEVSLGRLVEATQVDALLEGPGIVPQQLQVTFVHDTCQRCLRVSLGIPALSSRDSHVNVTALRIAGQPLLGPPFMIQIRQGVMAPLILRYSSAPFGTTPCISPEGRVYCPPGLGNEVVV